MTRFRGQPKSKSDQRNELLSAYLDGELNPSDRARLEAQLASDPALQAELDVLRRTVAMVHDLPFVPAPRNFLLPVAADRRRAPRPQPARRSWAAALGSVRYGHAWAVGARGGRYAAWTGCSYATRTRRHGSRDWAPDCLRRRSHPIRPWR